MRCDVLKEFTIKNFTSFNKEVLFSMEADVERVSEHNEHIVLINNNSLLKVVSMYGPNGGGKSNLLLALRLSKMLQNNKGYLDTYEYPCVFTNTDVIEETIFFVDEKYEMGYRFSMIPKQLKEFEPDTRMMEQYNGRLFFEIISEEVSYRKLDSDVYTLLFSRDKTGRIESDYFDEIKNKSEFFLAKGMSVISYMYNTFANRDIDLSEDLDVIRCLYQQISNIMLLDTQGILFYGTGSPYRRLIMDHEKELVKALRDFDINIKGIKVYPKRMQPFYFVKEIELNGEIVEKELSLKMESSGTQKVFWILVSLLINLENGKIFYCDDMNAYLHPKMLRAIIGLFQDNNYNSQLIFNSHDIINMDNALFRRDEIWFAYKDEQLATQLMPLSNIVNYKGEQVRKDAKFYKQYLEGRYGADPFIERGLNWNV